jgi:hypothetical protein
LLLPEYSGIVSSRAGRTNTKEQYGIFFRSPVKISGFNDLNPDPNNRWERPPIRVTFNVKNYQFTAYNLHTDPDTTPQEIGDLEKIVVKDRSRNIIVLGDLNADCGSYNTKKNNHFKSWLWAINEDTTVSSTNCAYDRIIFNADAQKEYVCCGVNKETQKKHSDHYLVWAQLKIHSDYDVNHDGIVNFLEFAAAPSKNQKELAAFARNWLYVP